MTTRKWQRALMVDFNLSSNAMIPRPYSGSVAVLDEFVHGEISAPFARVEYNQLGSNAGLSNRSRTFPGYEPPNRAVRQAEPALGLCCEFRSRRATMKPSRHLQIYLPAILCLMRILFVLVGLAVDRNANAQSGRSGLFPGPPIVGATPGLALPDTSNTSGASSKFKYGYGLPDQHKKPTGVACVEVHAFAQAQIINPKIFDHILVIENGCSAPIGLNMCYYQSKTCLHTTIGGYSRRQQTLGMAPDNGFRFSYTEDFY